VLHIAGNKSLDTSNVDTQIKEEERKRVPKGTAYISDRPKTAGEPGSGPEGSAWRAAQAKEFLKPAELGRSRAFSSTKAYPVGYGYHTREEEGEKGLDVQVVGFKPRPRIFLASGRSVRSSAKTGPESGQMLERLTIELPWQFWAQQSGEDGLTISRVWNILLAQ
jgi:hypothetical protein